MQKNRILVYLLLVSAMGAQANACLKTTEQLDPRFAGVWAAEGTSAQLTITAEQQTLCLTARDADDGEAFEASLPQWDGSTLRTILRMPSSNWMSLNVITFDQSQGVLIDELITQKGEQYRLIFRQTAH